MAIAQCTENDGKGAMYRQTHTDDTKFAAPGEELPDHPVGGWYPFTEDQPSACKDQLYFGNGPVWSATGEKKRPGDDINLMLYPGVIPSMESGLYRVIQVRSIGDGGLAQQMELRRIGDMDPTKFVYRATLCAC